MFYKIIAVAVSYLVHILVQNATDLTTKCDSYFLAKYDKSLLQKVSAFLLQNVTVTLQNATVITKCDDFIPKCDVYYEIRQYLQDLN